MKTFTNYLKAEAKRLKSLNSGSSYRKGVLLDEIICKVQQFKAEGQKINLLKDDVWTCLCFPHDKRLDYGSEIVAISERSKQGLFFAYNSEVIEALNLDPNYKGRLNCFDIQAAAAVMAWEFLLKCRVKFNKSNNK